MPRKEGQFLVEDYYQNYGGLNTADSPFLVQGSQATAGQNWDYLKRGAIQKRLGQAKLNSVADTQLKTLGLGLFDASGQARKVIRAAGTKVQNFDFNAFTFTNLSTDVASPVTSILPGTSTQPVVFSMFNNVGPALWMAGGGLTDVYGAYSATKITKNGVPAPAASSFTATAVGSGGTLVTGFYLYTLVYRKASTQVVGNALIEAKATTGNNDSVNLAWTLTNNDTTRYDKIYVFRSALNGASQFTVGDLIAQLSPSATTYTDTGTAIISSENVPRVNNVILDNSQLPTGTAINALTLYRQRLVVAVGSTLYFSNQGAPEGFPTALNVAVPSGGDITGLGIISFNTPTATAADEFLCVFKQRELWIVTGDGLIDSNGIPNLSLKFIDNSGAPNQSVLVNAQGNLSWLNYRGMFMWNGSGKPIYSSQSIENDFKSGGNVDKSKLSSAYGLYSQTRQEIQWYLSGKVEGEQKLVYRLDLRLTASNINTFYNRDALGGQLLGGVFMPDALTTAYYAGLTYIQSGSATDELQYLGDGAGFIDNAYSSSSDRGTAVQFKYYTPYLNLESPNIAKRFHKLVVWVLDTGVYNLTVDFWANYQFAEGVRTTQALAVDSALTASPGVWDVGKWDVSTWDAPPSTLKALTFNLSQNNNNAEGDSIRFRFSQLDTLNSVVIYGYSVYYTELGLRKVS